MDTHQSTVLNAENMIIRKNGHISGRRKVGFDYIFSWLVFFLTFLLIINAALPQMEMQIFSGHTPIPSVVIKIILIFLLALYILTYSDRTLNINSILSLLSLLSLFFIELVFLTSDNLPSYVLVFGIDTMYSLLMIALLMSNFHSTINPVRAVNVLLIISVPLVFLGIAQTVTNSPLLPLDSVDGYFKVLVWNYFGQVRAFSLFEAPAYYATYLDFLGGVILGRLLINRPSKNGIFYIFLLIMVTYSEFMTLNRTAIFAYVFVMFTVFSIFKMKYRKKNLIIVMAFAFLSSVGLMLAVPIIHQSFSFVFAFKDQSVFARYHEWQYWIHFISIKSHTILFGSGIFQSSFFSSTKGVIIDNMFLAVLVQFGVAGLIVVLLSIYIVWSLMVEKCLSVSSPMSISSIALITAWPIFSMFGTGLNIFPIYAAIPFLIKSDKSG